MYEIIIPFLIVGLVIPGLWVIIGTLFDNYFSNKKKKRRVE